MRLSAPLPVVIEPPAGIPSGFYQAKARELAQLITLGVDKPDILADYMGLNAAQWQVLRTSAYFKGLLAEAQEEYKDACGPVEKAKAMARMASPDAVTQLVLLSRSGGDPKVAKDAAETLLNIAGLATKAPAAAAGSDRPVGIAIAISFAPNGAPQTKVIDHAP